ncbi:hypothetical protein [Cohnella hashimotonis]|uniref:Uncharacterized protein n=1 Tax=Cohnella hashimotonis TaxID=2826895 RepID=A0ABT6TS97_9BACL|nr:hypothetical protein [Cohnella hashimotonis]MDI4649710.1 hypothetical protein [Cohnella hashimotonis]
MNHADLQNINAEVLEMIRKKQKQPEVLRRFFLSLVLVQENEDENETIDKEIVQEFMYTCFQFIVESNYTASGDMYFVEFRETYDVLKRMLMSPTSPPEEKLNDQFAELWQYEADTREFKTKYDAIKKEIKNRIHHASKEEHLQKALVLSVLNLTTSFLFRSGYWKHPMTHGLIRTNREQMLEADLVCFWELYELLMALIGMM